MFLNSITGTPILSVSIWGERLEQLKAFDTSGSKNFKWLFILPSSTQRLSELRYTFLSPKIIESILNGSQPEDLTITKLFKIKTLNWQEQEHILLY